MSGQVRYVRDITLAILETYTNSQIDVNLIQGIMINFDDRQIKWTDAIIKSMTPDERLSPGIINGSRRKRIAIGSGRSVQEVNQLLKQFHQMRQMMKKIGNNKGRMDIPFGIK